MLDVLPLALVSAAAAVRSFAREVLVPVPPTALEDPVLAAAVEDFASRWSTASADLARSAETAALALQDSAQEYVSVESLLVPRALR